MKKYKLIKLYPGIDNDYISVGDTFTESESGSYIQDKKKQFCKYCVSKREVENYPEFWEEVKEKEWEILELKNPSNSNATIDKLSIDIWMKDQRVHGNWEINTVKLLSDGEVFSVGDSIVGGTISQFIMKGEELQIWIKPNENRPAIFEVDPSLLEKRIEKLPVLTTEEGVNLYEGDQYWTVFSKEKPSIKPFKVYGPHFLKVNSEIEAFASFVKFFHSKENAEKYIERHGFNTLYGVNGAFTKTASSFKSKIKSDYAAGNWKWFNSEKERDLYIEENKPRFSKKDLLSFGKYVGSAMEFTNPLGMLYHWYRYVRKEK